MSAIDMSEYNSDQWKSFQEVKKVCAGMSAASLDRFLSGIQPYLDFRKEVEEYQDRYFGALCREACFTTGLSACCSFESIITFFADQAIAYLLSSPEEREEILRVLERPNTTNKCVYLGANGCLWPLRPVSCSMFFCDTAKRKVFDENPEAEALWELLREKEKAFTWPTQPVLFDEIEDYFIHRGAGSRHMFFHRSPGLLRMKEKAGIKSRFGYTAIDP